MLVMVLLSHAENGATTHGCTGCGRVAQPRDRSIEVLSHHEEVRYSCWLVAE
jgi:hypothetical protein